MWDIGRLSDLPYTLGMGEGYWAWIRDERPRPMVLSLLPFFELEPSAVLEPD
jgi:hypothetical protein